MSVKETTTSVGVGSGLASVLGTQNRPPIDKMAYDFYATYGTTNPSNAMTAFGDYTRAKGLSSKEARKLRNKITDDYGIYVLGDMVIPPDEDEKLDESPHAAHPLKSMASRNQFISPNSKRTSARTDKNFKPKKPIRVEGTPPGPSVDVQAPNPAGRPMSLGISTQSRGSFHNAQEGLALADDGIGAGKMAGGGPGDAVGSNMARRGQDRPYSRSRSDRRRKEENGALAKNAGAPGAGSGGIHNNGVRGGGPMGQHGAGPMGTNEKNISQELRRMGHTMDSAQETMKAMHALINTRYHNKEAAGMEKKADILQVRAAVRNKPELTHPVLRGKPGKPSGARRLARKTQKGFPTMEGQETNTGYLNVPGEPINTEDRHIFCVRQLGRGLFEISFDGTKTRHSLRMAEESMRYRLLGFGGPYLRHAPEIARWLTTDAEISDEYCIDTARGRAYILDNDGFKKHVRSELFI